MEMWITVLDYSSGSIRIHHVTDVPTDNNCFPDIDIERWLYDNDPEYKESSCYYMNTLEKPEIKED